jgi:hypothetical protein
MDPGGIFWTLVFFRHNARFPATALLAMGWTQVGFFGPLYFSAIMPGSLPRHC